MPRTIFHLDMDAFFAAIEVRDRPELRGKPVVVGSPPDKRGVVSTASYEAREFGIHSALPSRTAARRCPHAVFLPVDMTKYQDESRKLMAILRDVTPLVEPISVDEAFLDMTGVLRPGEKPEDRAAALQQRIRTDLDLTASVGIAPNKFLAKLASGMNKPEGITLVPFDAPAIETWLAALPVSDLWGVGKATLARMHAHGIHSVGDLQRQEAVHLRSWFGTSHGDHLWRLARGLDDRPVSTEREVKSISNEHTFDVDCRDPQVVRRTLLRLAEKVGSRLRQAEFLAGTAHLKIRYKPFDTKTRQKPLAPETHADRILVAAAMDLLEAEPDDRPVRLIGFGASHLKHRDDSTDDSQGRLFEEPPDETTQRHEALDSAVDALRQKYGRDAVQRGFEE